MVFSSLFRNYFHYLSNSAYSLCKIFLNSLFLVRIIFISILLFMFSNVSFHFFLRLFQIWWAIKSFMVYLSVSKYVFCFFFLAVYFSEDDQFKLLLPPSILSIQSNFKLTVHTIIHFCFLEGFKCISKIKNFLISDLHSGKISST